MVDEGDKGGGTDGMESDTDGRLYVTSYEHNAVLRRHPNGAYETLVTDPRLLFPDTLSLATDGFLYMSVNQLHPPGSLLAGGGPAAAAVRGLPHARRLLPRPAALSPRARPAPGGRRRPFSVRDRSNPRGRAHPVRSNSAMIFAGRSRTTSSPSAALRRPNSSARSTPM